MSPARGPRREWEDRERSLLDELEKLILAEGFTGLRLEDIAARLNVSRSTLYRLAASKQELIESSSTGCSGIWASGPGMR